MATEDREGSRGPKKGHGGRPRIPTITPDLKELEDKLPKRAFDLEKVMYALDLGATQEEIAGSFLMSVDTFSRKLKEATGKTFRELKKTSVGTAKIGLRSNQYKMTEKNAAMAIWLGKQWLGQKENPNEDNPIPEEVLRFISSLHKHCNEEEPKSEE